MDAYGLSCIDVCKVAVMVQSQRCGQYERMGMRAAITAGKLRNPDVLTLGPVGFNAGREAHAQILWQSRKQPKVRGVLRRRLILATAL